MQIFKWLGGFLQQAVQTNTAMEIAGSIADIHYNHKRPRGIWTLTVSILSAGGGACLFVLEPTVRSYFQPIVLQTLPFLGNVASQIFVGVLGGWLGGAFGHNVAKECARYFANARLGHTNTAYQITNLELQTIVQENPQIFNYNFDIEQAITQEQIDAFKLTDLQSLANLLVFLREQIDAHRDDGTTAHDEYKYALLSALRLSNLMPLLEILAKNDTKREIRKQTAVRSASYFAEVDEQFFGGAPIRPPVRRGGRLVRVRRNPFAQAQAMEPVEMEPIVAENPQMIPVPLVAQNQAPIARGIDLDYIPLKPEAVVFSNLKRHIKMLNHSEVKDPRRVKRVELDNGLQPTLNPNEKRALLINLKETYQQQNQKQVAVRQIGDTLLTRATGARHL